MKKLRSLLLMAVMVSFLLPGFSQTENQQNSQSIDFNKLGKVVPGKIFYKNGSIEEYDIKYDNPEDLKKLDNMIQYTKSDWAAFGTVPKKNLEAFEIDGHTWKRITVDGDEQFGIVHIDGAIKYFSIFHIPFARVTGDYKEIAYLQKLDEKPVEEGVFTLRYRKTILGMVADNEELKGKIEKKEKGYKNFFTFEKVINEYNDWYAEQHPAETKPESETEATEETPAPTSDLGIPESLFGVWKWKKNVFTITPGKVTAQIDVGGDLPNIIEWTLTNYDEEMGFIWGSIINVNSMGFDQTETYKDNSSGFLSFTELTDNTVILYYLGISIVETSAINDVKKDPGDVKFFGETYTKAE